MTLTLKSPLKLTKSVELIVQGTSPNGLQDAEGRLIDGANNGMAGSNAVATISKTGVTIDANFPAARWQRRRRLPASEPATSIG